MNISGIIVGLGNPGAQYASTRHNFGFMVIDHILKLAESRKSMRRQKVDLSGEFQLDQVCLAQKTYLLLKPFTYMNLSGKAVAKVAGRFLVPCESILAVHDELDLPLGRMKMKQGGGNGGHKGLNSIEECVGANNFYRLRLGIDRPEHSSQVSEYVLAPFPQEDTSVKDQMVEAAFKSINLFARRGLKDAVQFTNSFKPKYPEEEGKDKEVPASDPPDGEAPVDGKQPI